MSLEKAIKHGKSPRKPYYGSKSWDWGCRNHGSCSWCLSNRVHKVRRRELSADEQLKEYSRPK